MKNLGSSHRSSEMSFHAGVTRLTAHAETMIMRVAVIKLGAIPPAIMTEMRQSLDQDYTCGVEMSSILEKVGIFSEEQHALWWLMFAEIRRLLPGGPIGGHLPGIDA